MSGLATTRVPGRDLRRFVQLLQSADEVRPARLYEILHQPVENGVE